MVAIVSFQILDSQTAYGKKCILRMGQPFEQNEMHSNRHYAVQNIVIKRVIVRTHLMDHAGRAIYNLFYFTSKNGNPENHASLECVYRRFPVVIILEL